MSARYSYWVMESGKASVDVVVPGVGVRPIRTGREDQQREQRDDQAANHRVRPRDLPLAVGLGLMAPVAGIGLLWLLRGTGVADVGPTFTGALPLEQLAGNDAQPLVRVALAWLPVGLAAGAVIGAFTRSARTAMLTLVTLVAGVMLVISGGVSVAIENGEPLTNRLTAALGFSGTWAALLLFIIGAGVGERLARPAAPAPSAE